MNASIKIVFTFKIPSAPYQGVTIMLLYFPFKVEINPVYVHICADIFHTFMQTK